VTSSERRQRIEEICDAALDRDAVERAAFVASACGDDEMLRREVEALLAHAQTAEGFLAAPVALVVEDALAGDAVSMIGQRIAHYRIIEKVGAGGMGVVYRAEDTKLRRSVALKFLPPDLTRDEDAKHRFVLEAQTASALEHSNICTIYEIGEAPDGQLFLAMAYYVGETLKTKIDRGPLALEDALGYAVQIAEGLAKAHATGIVHRDIKPANVLVTGDGVVKIVDFGIAKLLGQTSVTRTGTKFGTLTYMSPEQVAGSVVDARSDLWSLGVVLYEMVAGQPPFRGEQPEAVTVAIAHAAPQRLTSLRSDVPLALEHIVNRVLAKSPNDRYQTAADLLSDLEQIGRESVHHPGAAWFASKPKLILALALVAVVLASAAVGWLWHRSSRVQWALETATPEIARLEDAGEFVKAAALARAARVVLPKDPTLERLWTRATGEVSIVSVPSEAEVSIRPYRGDPNTWETLGKTPLKAVRVPRNAYVWRLVKPGFAPAFFIGEPPSPVSLGEHRGFDRTLKLRPEVSVPPEMVVVPDGLTGLGPPHGQAPIVQIDGFLIDRHEVTNEEYKKFVDAGGYRKREFWKQPFLKDGQAIPWEVAVARFQDATGRPGPATWEVGSYPKGLENHPVAGVSWYEAAAYAEFAGKSLPTAYHWTLASQATSYTPVITPGSNFRSEGTQPVGSGGGLSGFGTTDMAGNVKEWCWNEGRDGNRFILGGGFGEPMYMFYFSDTQSPWDRLPNFGFRCVKLGSAPTAAAAAKIEVTTHDYSKDTPVSDEVFKAYRGLYAYDKGELNARVEETGTTAGWSREKVTFDAAYGHERVIAHLFLPKNGSPPFQTVVYFPGGFALTDAKLDLSIAADTVDFLLKSGRAVIFPIYKGTYERREGLVAGGRPTAKWRDQIIAFSKDLGRTIDYLETRQDIDSTTVAYLGTSLGGTQGALLPAIDKRMKAAILLSGGLNVRWDYLPEVDPLNFVRHVTIPVLMLNGRYDDSFPLVSSQLPLFRNLGTPAKDKKHVIYEGGHGAFPRPDAVRESLDWLDKYLGPVRR
jgi:dienelactone hydrolase